MNRLAPSILSADFSRLASSVRETERGGADLIHVDVMDGHFVPNISYGAVVMKSLLGQTEMSFDVHLMIEEPDRYLEDFMTEQTEFITVHQEACPHLCRTLQHIHQTGARAGVALNPSTPVHLLDCILEDLDLVLIMSVNPGFGGQQFLDLALDKIRELDRIKKERGLRFEIEVDGGVSLQNAAALCHAGTNIFVAGSAIFHAAHPTIQTRSFLNAIRE